MRFFPHASKVNAKLQIILDTDTEPWGIKVSKVDVEAESTSTNKCNAPSPSRPKPNASDPRQDHSR